MTFTTTPRSGLTSRAPLRERPALFLAYVGMGLIASTFAVHAEPGFDGRYLGRGEGQLELTVALPVRDAQGDGYRVDAFTGIPNACSGTISGIARRIAPSTLQLKLPDGDSAETCTLSLTFSPDRRRVKLEEKSCSTFHGPSCAFSGDLSLTPAANAKSTTSAPASRGAGDPSPKEQATKVEITDDLVTRVWTVNMLEGSPGDFFCEASMRGRNPAAGGKYGIRYRRELGAAPMLAVTYARPRLSMDGRMVITLDDRRLTTLALRATKIGRDEAVYATLDTSTINGEVFAEFEKPEALDFVIGVGGRTFMAPVRGWSIVTRAMDACMAQLRAR